MSHDDGQNHGKSTSRNLGIRSASGSYVGFLDADDVWLEDILEDQVTLLEANHLAGMVYGPIQWWYSWTGALEDRGRDYVEDLGVPSDSLVYPPTLLRLFLQDRAAVPSAMLIRRDAIDRAGMFEDEFRVLYEDQVFLSKLCLSEVVYASGECWYRYRQHPDSTCARTMITGEYYSTRPIFLRWLAIYLGQRQVRDAELWRAVDEEVWPLKHPIAHRWLERVATRFPVEKWIARTEGALRRSRLAAGLSKAW